MTHTLCRRAAALLIVMGILLLCMAGMQTGVSAETSGSLSLRCVQENTILDGMHWQIYKVGHREGDDFAFDDAFADYRVTLGDRSVNTNEWDARIVAAAAETLRVYTVIDKIPSREEGWTDSQGDLVFSGLEDGLYLVCGDILKRGQYTYVPGAVFFEMRGEEAADLNAFPKIIYNTLDERTVRHTVRKVWQNDADQPWNREVSVTVELYRDGAYDSTVVLSDENDWSYTWEAPASEEWHCVEKVIPAGYSVIYRENLTQFLIVNTYGDIYDSSYMTDTQTSTTPETTMDHDKNTTSGTATGTQETPPSTSDRTGETTDVSSGSSSPSENSSAQVTTATTRRTTTVPPPDTPPGGSGTGSLPQTGQLWWPVPLMGFGGLLLIGAGLTPGRRGKEENDG